jgi:DNA repair exonuclease SbcCD nuclease subunit
MKEEVAFIAFSDIQVEDWKRHSKDHRRLHLNGVVVSRIVALCKKYDCPALFCGDLFDNPKALDNYTLNHVFKWFNHFRNNGIHLIAISGNHDQSESNFLGKESPNYIKMMADVYSNVTNLDFKTITHQGFDISGIPFITGNVDYAKAMEETRSRLVKGKKHILLIHTDLWGAKDTLGRVVDSVQNIPAQLDKFFEGFDLVLCGHIHKPQLIRRNILMLGATHQQRVSDAGTDMKIWKLTKSLKAIPVLTRQPVFTYKGNPDYDFILPPPIKEAEEADPVKVSFKSTNPLVLAKNFLKANKIKSKPKLNILLKYLKDAGE